MKRLKRLVRMALKTALTFFACLLLYGLAMLIGMNVPVNTDFDPDEGDVTVYVRSNGFHTDVIMPLADAETDWFAFFADDSLRSRYEGCAYAAFGWGDTGFWLDSREGFPGVPTTLYALFWPSETAMHTRFFREPPLTSKRVRRLRLSPERYARLLAFVKTSFATDANGIPSLMPERGYNLSDCFFVGSGAYWFGYTCNDWTNAALKRAGVRQPLWSPLPDGVMAHLPLP